MSCSDYPTANDAKRFKNNADSTNEFVTSPNDTFTDQDGGTHNTIEGINTLAETQRDQFDATFTAQFTYARVGNISDFVGDTLTDAEKLNSYQYPDNSGDWYGPIQSQTFPITIPSDPTVSGSGWSLVNGLTSDSLSEYTDIAYKASGGNSAVENMVLGIPIAATVGDICSCEGVGVYKRISDFSGDLSDFEPQNVISIQAYTGSVSEKIESAISDLPDSGGIIDATSLTGDVLLTSDPFIGSSKPFIVSFGLCTLNVDMTQFELTLGTNQSIKLNGTKIQPSQENTDAYRSTSIVRTKTFNKTGSISSGSNQLTVDNVDDIYVGCLVAIDGAKGVENNEQHPLTLSISSSDVNIEIDDASKYSSKYTLYIGSECITGTQKSGNTLVNVTRGAFGTTAQSHNSGDIASFSAYLRALVKSISGNVVTLSVNATETVTNSNVIVGSLGVNVLGSGVIDGRLRRDLPNSNNNIFGVGLYLATQCYVSQEITFSNWDHGGAYLESSWGNNILGKYTSNSRPNDNLGANIWVFRGSSLNVISPSLLRDSYVGVFVDDRTGSCNLFDGSSNKNQLLLPSVDAVSSSVAISGSNDNIVISPFMNGGTPINIATNTQGTTPRGCSGNSAVISRTEGSSTGANVKGQGNVVKLGTTNLKPSVTGASLDVGRGGKCVIEYGDFEGEYYGNDFINPTKEFISQDDMNILLTSKNTILTTGDLVASFLAKGSDVSGAGEGIKGGFKVKSGNQTGSSYELIFTSGILSQNDVDVWKINTAGAFVPILDDTYNIGTPSLRVDTINLVNPPSVTSDDRYKNYFEILDTEKRVASKIKLKKFKYSESVEKKGDKSRFHFGYSAQEVVAAFESEGLSAMEYALIRKVPLHADPEIKIDYDSLSDDEFRYEVLIDQLNAFLISAS